MIACLIWPRVPADPLNRGSGRRVSRSPGAQGVLFARLAIRRACPVCQGQPAALRLQLRRGGGAASRRRRGRDGRENLILSAAFDKDGEDAPGVATGILSLYYGDRKIGEGRIKTQSAAFGLAGKGLFVGRNLGEVVTEDCPGTRPWPFTGGTISLVAVDVSGQPYLDLERASAAMLARE